MKKILMFGIAFVVVAVSLISTNKTLAVGIGGHSIDVTVGEVDKIDTDEDQDINAPQTGVFGLKFNEELMTVSAVLIIPIMIFLVFLFKKIYLRFRRNEFNKTE